MTDVAVQLLDAATPGLEGYYDLAFFGGDLVPDAWLRTAVYVSLLTDAEYPDAEDGDRRGWWGDALNEDPADRWGSHLWLLERSKLTADAPAKAAGYAKAALQWLISRGIAGAVDVTAELVAGGIDLHIAITPPAVNPQTYAYAGIWAQAGVDPFADAGALAGREVANAAIFDLIYYIQYPKVA